VSTVSRARERPSSLACRLPSSRGLLRLLRLLLLLLLRLLLRLRLRFLLLLWLRRRLGGRPVGA
jgi:hypothetical protein